MTVLYALVDGLSTIVRKEGALGLFRGTSLALFGVSNGAIQFVVYEKMKAWGFERKRRQYQIAGKVYDKEADKLVCRASIFLTRTNKIYQCTTLPGFNWMTLTFLIA